MRTRIFDQKIFSKVLPNPCKTTDQVWPWFCWQPLQITQTYRKTNANLTRKV